LPKQASWGNAGGTAVLVAAAVGVGVLSAFADEIERPVLLVALGLIIPLPIVVRVLQRRFDPFEPIVLITLALLGIFFVRPIAQLGYGEMWLTPDLNTEPGFDKALLVGLVGVVAIYAGYAVRAGEWLAERLPKPPRDVSSDLGQVAGWGLIVLGILLFGVFLATGGGDFGQYVEGRSRADRALYGQSSAYFYFGPLLVVAGGLVLSEIHGRTKSFASLAGMLFAAFFILLITLGRGDRSYLLILGFTYIPLLYIRHGRRPKAVNIVLGLLLGLFVFTFLVDYRDVETRTQSAPAAILDGLAHPGREFKELALGPDTQPFAQLSLLTTHVKDRQTGKVITSLLAAPVPGSLWKDKPREPAVSFYKQVYPDIAAVKEGGTSLSIIGTFYYDSRWLGVVLYGLLLGIGFRTLYAFLVRNPDNISARLLYVCMFSGIWIFMRDSPTQAMGGVGYMMGFLFLALFFASRRIPAQTRRPAAAPAATALSRG
jgi:hypothetical protein